MIQLHRLALAAALAVSGLVLAAVAHAQGTMRMVAHSDLKILDPIWTTAFISRNHGYMVYDTLFSKDADLKVQPQMVDKWTISDDKLTWTFVLRDGLEFHDGAPVTSEDVIASLKRWGEKDPLGQQLMSFTKELAAVDAKTFRLVLKEPYGLVLESLGKPSSNVPFIMPKRIAETPSNQQIKEYIGSGPFIFKTDEWKPGEKVVYLRNPRYKPRNEPPSGLAGGKVVKLSRVEWLAISDPMTAANALIAGEIDLIEAPPADLYQVFRDDKNIELFPWNERGAQVILRMNHIHPPFNNVKARQAVLYATTEQEYLEAQIGDPKYYSTCNAPLVCKTPNGKEYGDLLIKPDLAKARQLLKESGYDGTPIVMLHQTDLQSSNKLPPVGKAQLEAVGFKVELLAMDWQSVVARRTKKDPPREGGWNIFYTTTTAVDSTNPVANSFVAANCDKAWFGWPCDEEMEKLRTAYARETDPAKQVELAHKIQDRVFELAIYAPIGEYKQLGAYRKDRLQGWIPAPVPVWWNISKQGS